MLSGRDAVLIGKRFLYVTNTWNDSNTFFWLDLAELGYPLHHENLYDSLSYPIVAIPDSNSFFGIIRAYPDSDEAPQPERADEDAIALPMETDYATTMGGDPNSFPVVVDPDETLVLMEMSASGPNEIARWPVLRQHNSATYCVGNSCIGCLSMDSKFINIHDARNGFIRYQVPVPASALDGVFRISHNWTLFGSIVTLHDGLGKTTATDTETGTSMDTSTSSNGLIFGSHGRECLTILLNRNLSDWPGTMQVHNQQDGRLLHSWKMPDHYVSFGFPPTENIVFSPDSREIIFFTQDGRVLFVDKNSGTIVRTIQPRFWIPYISFFVAVGTLAWVVCWIRFSIRCTLPYWLDTYVILLMAFVFLWWRIKLSGCYRDYDRLAWLTIVALLIATGTLVVHQTVYARRRLSFRILPSFAFVAMVVISIQICVEQGGFANALLKSGFIVGFFLLLGSLISHRFCPPFGQSGTILDQQSTGKYRLSLKQLILMTAMCATFMAALRILKFDWSVVRQESVGLATVGCFALLADCVVACRGAFVLKTAFIAALFAFAGIAWGYRQGWLNSPSLEIFAKGSEFIAVLGIATIYVAAPIAMRQRRLLSTNIKEIACVCGRKAEGT